MSNLKRKDSKQEEKGFERLLICVIIISLKLLLSNTILRVCAYVCVRARVRVSYVVPEFMMHAAVGQVQDRPSSWFIPRL